LETEILKFNLVSPLYFAPGKDLNPFEHREGEALFCFDLDEGSYMSFEPDKTKLLEKLTFCGYAIKAGEDTTDAAELPAGNYIFAQKREILSREEITALAAEIQQEGLWQRLLPGKKLYLRYLFEDGRFVTQIFRPYTES